MEEIKREGEEERGRETETDTDTEMRQSLTKETRKIRHIT